MADRTNFIEADEILMLVEKIGEKLYPTVLRGPIEEAKTVFKDELLVGDDKEISFARIAIDAIGVSLITEGEDVSEEMAAAWLDNAKPDPDDRDLPEYVKGSDALEDYAEEYRTENGFDPVREYGTYNATAL